MNQKKSERKSRTRHRKITRRRGVDDLGTIPENAVEFDGIDYRASVGTVYYVLEFSRDADGGYIPQIRMQPTTDGSASDVDDERDCVIAFAGSSIGDLSVIPNANVSSSVIIDRLLKTRINNANQAEMMFAATQNEMLAMIAAVSTTLAVEADDNDQVTFTLQIGEFTAQTTVQLSGNLALMLVSNTEETSEGPTAAELSQIAAAERRTESRRPVAVAS
ncbi:MAG: hypothetical protein KIH65_003140 [Candidatus Uhrbacteria bacterium]|nr:hypothetical protein [Candidatus Uhrbacteria bacterium]